MTPSENIRVFRWVQHPLVKILLIYALSLYAINCVAAKKTLDAGSKSPHGVIGAISSKVSSQQNSLDEENEIKDTTGGLNCPPCEQIHCWPAKASRLRCKGGITVGVCNCCPACAKVEGEPCGGQWNYLGKCDRGLVCQSEGLQSIKYVHGGIEKVYTLSKGVCAKASSDGILTADQGHVPFCRPKCTPEYCTKNPKAICSAVDNADKLQECQGSCQHTSCRACRFLEAEPHCLKCRGDDFQCLRHFGRCFRREFCTKKRFPCGNSSHDEEINRQEKFVCKVPECLDG